MDIAAPWVVKNSVVNQSAAQIYTVPSTGYNRDLIVANAGTVSIYAGLSTDGTVATSAASSKILAGGALIFAGQVAAGAVVSVIAGTGNGLADVGYVSLLSFT